ncbi:MAG: maleylpyruvate isomerase family mycothiol-dependent enzyme [Actinomycetota bacterium]
MKRAAVHEAVAHERSALVDELRGLRSEQWEMSSLCDGWTIRDVVAHLVRLEAIYRYSVPFPVGLLRYGFRVNRYIAEDARRLSEKTSPFELLDRFSHTRYEKAPFARWHPVAAVPLSELILHGVDIRQPLGLSRRYEVGRLVPVANLLKHRLGVFGRGPRPTGVRFEATDADWAWGKGSVVAMPVQEIVLRLGGRARD